MEWKKMTLLDNFLACATFTPYEERLVENTKNNDYEIDTCFCNDTNKYETAICRNNNDWIIVEEYDTKEQSKINHKKWVEFTKNKPLFAFDIHLEEFICFD